MIKPEHLQDIDFRTKAERQASIISDLTNWYETLLRFQNHKFSDIVQAQITILSSVLWYLLPEKDYKKLTKL